METCGTLQWCHEDHVLLNSKKARKNRSSPGSKLGYLRMLIRDGSHSATQCTNLHMITSTNYNDMDLKDASKTRRKQRPIDWWRTTLLHINPIISYLKCNIELNKWKLYIYGTLSLSLSFKLELWTFGVPIMDIPRGLCKCKEYQSHRHEEDLLNHVSGPDFNSGTLTTKPTDVW